MAVCFCCPEVSHLPPANLSCDCCGIFATEASEISNVCIRYVCICCLVFYDIPRRVKSKFLLRPSNLIRPHENGGAEFRPRVRNAYYISSLLP